MHVYIYIDFLLFYILFLTICSSFFFSLFLFCFVMELISFLQDYISLKVTFLIRLHVFPSLACILFFFNSTLCRKDLRAMTHAISLHCSSIHDVQEQCFFTVYPISLRNIDCLFLVFLR